MIELIYTTRNATIALFVIAPLTFVVLGLVVSWTAGLAAAAIVGVWAFDILTTR